MNKISKEILELEYLYNEKPMWLIAKEKNIAIGTVYNYIKKYGIKSRKHLTDEAKRKISIANTGRPSACKGVKMSDETKKKISQAKMGKYRIKSVYGGHKKQRKDGYISVYAPRYISSSKDGYILEHILVMETHIGRQLRSDEVVHHKNKIKNDNRIENLELMTRGEHTRLHMLERYKRRDDLSIR